MEYIRYNIEFEKKLNVAVIGCGGHSYRNILPTFQYAPVNLVAVCDLDLEKANKVGRVFGALHAYADYKIMLQTEKIDAVFLILGYDQDSKPLYPKVAKECMLLGAHVWMEKPPASSSAEIAELMAVSEKTHKTVMVGFKKMFFPSIQKVKEIIHSEAFGSPTSFYIKYVQGIPLTIEDRQKDDKMLWFLDHIVHPLSILVYLFGDIESIYFSIQEKTGAAITNITFKNHVIGVLHLAAGTSGTAPIEHLEVIGEGANVILENGIRLRYFQKGDRVIQALKHTQGGYGRMSSYIGDDDVAPIIWEPEFSLGQLYNKNIFMLGYQPEILHFCQAILQGVSLANGTLNQALMILKVYEAFKKAANQLIQI